MLSLFSIQFNVETSFIMFNDSLNFKFSIVIRIITLQAKVLACLINHLICLKTLVTAKQQQQLQTVLACTTKSLK